jgi:16S rRNA processing protein RimM
MTSTPSFIIGRVSGVHGLAGNLKVWSFADSIDTFCPGTCISLKSSDTETSGKDDSKLYTILQSSPNKKGVILQIEGPDGKIDTRELAEELVGQDISINREFLPEPEEDSWYWQDLYGLDVVDHIKGFIGKITEVFPTGANDVLVVKNDKLETLVPMHKNFVESVDLESKTVKTTLPEDY